MAAMENALALVRVGWFRFGHGGHGGDASGLLVVVGLVFAGALIWALTRSRNTTA